MGAKRKYILNENFFETLDKKSMYWLGFIYADGCITNRKIGSNVLEIKLNIKDINHLEKFKSDIETNKPIYTRIETTPYGTVEWSKITIISNKIVNDLLALGVNYKKSLILEIPKIISNHNLFNSFVSGYFDGDGSIHKRVIQNKEGKKYDNVGISICGTKQVLETFCNSWNWLESSIPVYKDTRFKNKDIFSLKLYSKKRVKLFFENVYLKSDRHLERKLVLFKELI